LNVYGDKQSGNCYKVQLLLSLLGIEYHWHQLNILDGDTKTPQFLALNPNGKIPTVALDDGRVLCESNAILGYFAEGSAFIPSEAFSRAKVYEWLFFEQYSHEPCIAVARFIQKYLGLPENRQEEYRSLQAGGNKALTIMESTLTKTPYLVGNTPSIADIALYAYTHVANEGGFDLHRYPGIRQWCTRIESLDGYEKMTSVQA
jgi:glutathione S-transferase